VALVGYTNAGKSTLFNALTRGAAPVSDQLFMTLDPLVRKVRLGPGREILLVDTVGFIQKLPHSLVAAFRATLEEVNEAALLLNVVDASTPGVEEREAAVEAVLREIGAADRPRLLVLNKADRTAAERRAALAEGRPGCAVVSALSGEGLDGLLAAVASHLDLEPRRVRLSFAAADRSGVSGVYAAGRVLGHEVVDGRILLEAEMPGRALERYREHLL
jgi:GTP-binding protein HflX